MRKWLVLGDNLIVAAVADRLSEMLKERKKILDIAKKERVKAEVEIDDVLNFPGKVSIRIQLAPFGHQWPEEE